MTHPGEIIIRAAKISDLKNLIIFFRRAYGEQTVFQDKKFLLYYFTSPYKALSFSYNIIAIDPNGIIVAHYGGLNYRLIIGKDIKSTTWGVNAFTLPDWRGKGINSKIVKYLIDKNEMNAAIGMDDNVTLFYKKLNYNIFNKKRLSRFVYALKNEVYDLVFQLGQDQEKAKKIIPIKIPEKVIPKYSNIVELTKTNIKNYELDLDAEVYATTYRDKTFLSWRLFNNPFIKYKVWGFVKHKKIVSYLVAREETLQPTTFKVNRIVDLFGEKEGVQILLKNILNLSYIKNYLYVDFSAFGNLYSEELTLLGFKRLENEDACLLPLVSSPIENRPNNEFVVIGSKNNQELINKLFEENIYFTRIDGDRDRINRLNQIN
jgi:GNAT superfamily N-acetyltransferase